MLSVVLSFVESRRVRSVLPYLLSVVFCGLLFSSADLVLFQHQLLFAGMTASKDMCDICKKSFYGKQKFLRCFGPCSARFHLSCLRVSDAEYSCYTLNGESTYKCDTCDKKLRSVRSENTPVRSLRSVSASETGGKMATAVKEAASQRNANDALSAQLEAVRINGVHTNNKIENLIEMVLKLTEEVGQLRKENKSMKLMIDTMHMAAQPRDPSVQDLLPRRDVTSLGGPKLKAPKSYKDALSVSVSTAIVSPKTTINEVRSEGTVVPGLPVTSARGPGSADDGFITVSRKKRVEPPGSANSSKKVRPTMIGVRSSSSLSVIAKRVENIHNKEAMLEAAHALRLEREREKSLGNQKQEQQASLTHTEQQVQRLQQQLKEMQQAASGATAEGLLQRLEEETNVNTYIVKQKLPKEIGIRNNDLEILRLVLSEPVMSRGDLDALNSKIHSVNSEITQMVEHHLAANNPADDKLAPFRQQAAIIARKKETTAEHLTELRNKLSAAEEELQEKKSQLKEFAGETVLRGEEFKRYVTKLRGRSSLYKRQRTELSALKAEAGVLTRTVEILRARDEAVLRGLAMEEAQHGVSGFRVTEERMEQVSGEKANVDHEKGQTLEEMSSLVLELTQRIATKKAQLAPIIKELRPLRESCQVLTAEYEQKKHVYDTTAAGLESATAKLEQEVQNLKEEIRASESKYHLLEAESVISQVKLDQIAEEMQRYVGNTAGSDKTKSLRDRLTQKINELEKLSRQLKDDQHIVKENQANRSKQMKLWTDLQKLLECKKRCLEEERQNTGTVHREKGAETLVLQ